MSETLLTSYEEVPYDSKPLHPAHPDCLATVATLFGMTPASVDRCRVLELGCASAGNLIPLALSLPASRFVGIDLSPRQIDMGQQVVNSLGLTNLALEARSILDIHDDFGEFDYIICHGVYSWTPPEVQNKILSLCDRNLAPQGVAYISYNTYPGWHGRSVVREMLSYHVKRFDDPQVRVQQARAFLEFLVRANPNPESHLAELLREEAELLRPAADSYLFHEHLEAVNHPVYFHQFAEAAAAHGLQYLGEALFHSTFNGYSPEVRQTLQELSTDLIQLEQYQDFLKNRTFRRTLLTHATVPLNRSPSPAILRSMHLEAASRPLSEKQDIQSTEVQQFRSDDGSTASTNIPVVKAALWRLYEVWPGSISFADLWHSVRDRFGQTGGAMMDSQAEDLAAALLQCYLANLVALHVHPPRMVLNPGPRPLACPLARLQASQGERITNRRHRLVQLHPLDCVIVQLLDGQRDHEAILDRLCEDIVSGKLHMEENGQPLRESQRVRVLLSEALPQSLNRLARSSLLLA
jgi:methyltransferase-like protein/cyclopropane fatty-acyl-phospholipid synthase-like methyltransferase